MWALICGSLAAKEKIALYGKRPANTPAANAVRVLESALTRQGIVTRWIQSPKDLNNDEALVTFSATLPGRPESFAIQKTTEHNHGAVAISGAGDIGLAYGVFELLGQMESDSARGDFFQAVSDVKRTPGVRVRSIAMSVHNRDLEREWFYSKDFWTSYFELLAKSRFNQFTLIFGHQTPYFAPVFPFMLDVPGYEGVKTPDFSRQDRANNLAALRMVSELAGQWGIEFILGMWQFNSNNYGRNLVEGLSYEDLFEYCPKALAILLKQCPDIKGVQFRMNSESGIRENDQNWFFRGMADSLHAVGRPMWIEFRAKGLRAETIASADAVGLHTTVLTKYWREHMGLPFQGTRIDPSDKERSYRRYGYWDLLYHNRPYGVLYELWSFGSQKVLLWGGSEYARQFAASAHLGDADGFEVFAPLSQRGYGNWPGGAWHLFANRDLEYTQWELERYWAFYMTFGLAGYSMEARQPILEGEFRQRFGPASSAMQQAYEAASHVLPFVTAVRAPSASSFGYWPELDTCGLTDYYSSLGTGDDNLFYRIDNYIEDYLGGRYSARLTPDQMASRLDGWSASIRSSLQQAESLSSNIPNRKEFASTKTDFNVDAELAGYHSERIRSAEAYQFFARKGERLYLLDAIDHYRKAIGHWEAIVKLTEGVYYDHMVFNRPPDQVGHWKDELPLLKADLVRLEEIDRVFIQFSEHPTNADKSKIQLPRYKLTMKWKDDNGVIKRWAETTPVPDEARSLSRYSMQDPQFAAQGLFSRLRYATILHVPMRAVNAGAPVSVHASLLGNRLGVHVTLHYRYSGRGFHFAVVNMTEVQSNIYSGSIPAAEAGKTIFYYIHAVDQTDYFEGSEKEPHAVIVRAAGAPAPIITHNDIQKSLTGQDIPIRVKVQTAQKAAAVRLYYRHLDQSEDWITVDMKTHGGSEYEAAIPGEFVVPNWDITYEIEALDVSGAGTFYPGFDTRDPFVVTRVQSR